MDDHNFSDTQELQETYSFNRALDHRLMASRCHTNLRNCSLGRKSKLRMGHQSPQVHEPLQNKGSMLMGPMQAPKYIVDCFGFKQTLKPFFERRDAFKGLNYLVNTHAVKFEPMI